MICDGGELDFSYVDLTRLSCEEEYLKTYLACCLGWETDGIWKRLSKPEEGFLPTFF